MPIPVQIANDPGVRWLAAFWASNRVQLTLAAFALVQTLVAWTSLTASNRRRR